jgi:ankyrin repeat protein
VQLIAHLILGQSLDFTCLTSGKHEIVELLLSLEVPVDLELSSATGSALTLASMQGQAKTIEVLLEHNANVIVKFYLLSLKKVIHTF